MTYFLQVLTPFYLANHTLYCNPFLVDFLFYIPIVIISGNTFQNDYFLRPKAARQKCATCTAPFPSKDYKKNDNEMLYIRTSSPKVFSSSMLMLSRSYQKNTNPLFPLRQKGTAIFFAVPFCVVFSSASDGLSLPVFVPGLDLCGGFGFVFFADHVHQFFVAGRYFVAGAEAGVELHQHEVCVFHVRVAFLDGAVER